MNSLPKMIHTDSAQTLLVELINAQKQKEQKNDIWKDSPYKDLINLQSNNAGIVGENFVKNICLQCGIAVDIDGTKTKKIGGGEGDGFIKDKTIEIKTAHQGSSNSSFQHELGETPWKADYMLFVDISPSCIYLTIFKNFEEVFYKNSSKCVPYFPTKGITWRKKSGAFKLDTTIIINEKNIENKYTLKIDNTTDLQEIKEFIELSIV